MMKSPVTKALKRNLVYTAVVGFAIASGVVIQAAGVTLAPGTNDARPALFAEDQATAARVEALREPAPAPGARPAFATKPASIPRKLVVAEVSADTADQIAFARAAGIEELTEPGQPVTVEMPAELVTTLQSEGLEVRIMERFLQVVIAPGEAETDPGAVDTESSAVPRAGCTDYLSGSNSAGTDIPDDPDGCYEEDSPTGYTYLSVGIPDNPEGVVCRVEYRTWMEHTYPANLEIQLNNSSHDFGDGFIAWYWDGGTDDGGMDDDVETDEDIYLNWRDTSFFNGDPVTGTWYLDVWDHCPGNTGHINYIQFRIFYDLPEIRVEPSPLVINCEETRDRASAEDETPIGLTGELPVDLSPEDKLIDADLILAPLTGRDSTTPVIIGLKEPKSVVAATNWDDPASLGALHAEIKARQNAVLGQLTNREIQVEYRYDNLAAFSGSVTKEGLDKLLNDPMVRYVEPVREMEWHTNQGIPLINALATRPTFNGTGVSIAICDSGFDYMHPRLGGAAFPNSKIIGGWDFGDNDNDPMADGMAHGTACAGIAAGNLGTVGDYIGGVAPDAKIYGLKISQGLGGPTTSGMVASWDWSVTHKNDDPANPILVISSSFGGGRHTGVCDAEEPTMARAAEVANAAGITVLASSGNDGFCNAIEHPACASSVIAVGAVYDANVGAHTWCVSPDSCVAYACGGCSTGRCADDLTSAADQVTAYSNTANTLDIFASSNDAYTTDITGAGGYSAGDYDTEFGGTSAACPYAAGAVAAMQSAAKARTGSFLSPDEVRARLVSTGTPITDSKAGITKPRVDLEAAIETIACDGQHFRIHNDGGAALAVASITGIPTWATLDPLPPFSVPPGGSRAVCVEANCSACDGENLWASLSINSNDPSQPTANVTIRVGCPGMGVCCLTGEGECAPGVCGDFDMCHGNNNCLCAIDSEGGGTCVSAFGFCPPWGTACTSIDDCDPGEICQLGSCCDEVGVCVSLCPTRDEAGPAIEEGMVNLAGGLLSESAGDRSDCVRTTASDCAAYGGAYWGDDTTCDAISCPDCDEVLVHVATDENIGYSDGTLVDYPLTRGNPDAILLATHLYNPGGIGGLFNDSPLGVYFSSFYDDWTIFHETELAMWEGSAYNVEVLSPSDSAFIHTATPDSIYVDYTVIDHPLTNGNPDAILLVTQNLTPTGERNPSPVGVWYSFARSQWTIFNEDYAGMPVGASFNVEVLPESASVFTHVATPDNSYYNFTMIDHPLLNGNPSAIVLVTQNLNAGGIVRNNQAIGVWYWVGEEQWGIFNQDAVTPIPENAGFNVKVASECLGVGPPQACCFMDGSCAEVPPDLCWRFDGSSQGVGSTCANATCPVYGACCYWGECLGVIEESLCLDEYGGIWFEGAACDEIECPEPPPTGACCVPPVCEGPGECPFDNCAGNWNCFCFETAEEQTLCAANFSCFNKECPNGSSDCGPGEVCFVNTCCDGPRCAPEQCTMFRGEAGATDEPTASGHPLGTKRAPLLDCMVISQDACLGMDGIYLGDEVSCADNWCGCADGAVAFANPEDGFYDARQPHPVYDAAALQGVYEFKVDAPEGADYRNGACWELCETNNNPGLHPGLPGNAIDSVLDGGGGRFLVRLVRPIAHGEVTTLTYHSATGATVVTGEFAFHPGDANASGMSEEEDIKVLAEHLDGGIALSKALSDMNRSGRANARDLLRLIDLLNGAGAYEPWNEAKLDPWGCP